jgi:hypothetical protein
LVKPGHYWPIPSVAYMALPESIKGLDGKYISS